MLKNCTIFKVPSPFDLDYLSAILAFFIEAFLFSEHLHGRSMLDQKVLSLIGFSYRYKISMLGAHSSVLPCYIGCYSRDIWNGKERQLGNRDGSDISCDGSWSLDGSGGLPVLRLTLFKHHCIQAGFILFPKWVNSSWSSWEPDDHHQMMILPMMFAWHIMAVIFWQSIIMAITYRKAKAVFGQGLLKNDHIIQYSRYFESALVPTSC